MTLTLDGFMKNSSQHLPLVSNRTAELAGFYSRQWLTLGNIAMQHWITQMNESLSFAVDSYQLGFEANLQASKMLAQQMEDSLSLTHGALQSQSMSGNPLSNMALSVVRNALNTSHAVLNGVKPA